MMHFQDLLSAALHDLQNDRKYTACIHLTSPPIVIESGLKNFQILLPEPKLYFNDWKAKCDDYRFMNQNELVTLCICSKKLQLHAHENIKNTKITGRPVFENRMVNLRKRERLLLRKKIYRKASTQLPGINMKSHNII